MGVRAASIAAATAASYEAIRTAIIESTAAARDESYSIALRIRFAVDSR